MQYADPSIWSEVERLTKSIALKRHFPTSELEDLEQDVKLKVWVHRDKALAKGIHYGYVRSCIKTEIANHNEQHRIAYYSGELTRSDEVEDNPDRLIDEGDSVEDLAEFEQLGDWVIALCDDMRDGVRKEIFRCILSGKTDGGSKQGRDIAARLNRDQKSVSQSLSWVRKHVKSKIKAL